MKGKGIIYKYDFPEALGRWWFYLNEDDYPNKNCKKSPHGPMRK